MRKETKRPKRERLIAQQRPRLGLELGLGLGLGLGSGLGLGLGLGREVDRPAEAYAARGKCEVVRGTWRCGTWEVVSGWWQGASGEW